MTEFTVSDAPRPVGLWLGLWRQLPRADKHRLRIAAGAMLVSSGLTALLPVLVGNLIDRVVHSRRVGLDTAVGPLAEIAILVIVTQLLDVARRQLVHNVSTRVDQTNRSRVYEHLTRLPLTRLRQSQIGALYGRTSRSLEGAERLLKLGALDLLPAVMLAIAAIFVAFSRDPRTAVAMAAVVPTGFALVHWQVHSQARVRRMVRDEKEKVDASVNEMLPALDVIRAAGAADRFLDRVAQSCANLRRIELRHHRAMAIFDAAKVINEVLWLIVALAVAIELAPSGGASAGALTTYFLLYTAVITPLRELHRIVDEASESAQQADDLHRLLDEPQDDVFRRQGKGGAISHACYEPDAPRPALRVEELHFKYPRKDVLRGVSLVARAGEHIALVGLTNSGKSTLVKLILQLEHRAVGRIEIDGRDVRAMDNLELRRRIGYLPQEPRVFCTTVRWNITLGRDEITADELHAAAKRAHVHADILALPDGYDTVIAERGDSLSGGQKQRLCLARALVRPPSVLILDEPTASLDGKTQAAVQRTLEDLDVTLLVIAHRLTTLRKMDRIYVLNEGRIVQQGSYDSLVAMPGLFRQMLTDSEGGGADGRSLFAA